MAFYFVEGDCSKVGGAVFVLRIGNMDTEADTIVQTIVNGLALTTAPSHCSVPISEERTGTTLIEQLVVGYMRQQSPQTRNGLRSASGKLVLSSKDGIYLVLDRNDMPHRGSGRAVGFERMQQVGGVIREMVPETFKEFCSVRIWLFTTRHSCN